MKASLHSWQHDSIVCSINNHHLCPLTHYCQPPRVLRVYLSRRGYLTLGVSHHDHCNMACLVKTHVTSVSRQPSFVHLESDDNPIILNAGTIRPLQPLTYDRGLGRGSSVKGDHASTPPCDNRAQTRIVPFPSVVS